MPAECARAWHTTEQPEHMAGDGMQANAARELVLDIGNEGPGAGLGIGNRRSLTEPLRIDSQQPPRLLIGGAPHHHAVEMAKMLRGLLDAGDAAIEHDGELWMPSLEPVDATIIERRNLAVLGRRKPLKPGLARVHDQRIDARTLDRAGERFERLLGILRVDTDPALDGHRHTHLRPHGGDAITDQRRLSHQAGAEAPLLYAVRRAADIEVDLGV